MKDEGKFYDKIVRKLSEPNPPEWVSIEDGFPADGLTVLVFSQSDGMFGIGFWDSECWIDQTSETIYGVTHWMPLPEPPTDNQNNQPTCRRCGEVAKRGKALNNLFSGSSEWSDGSMDGATMSLSGAAELIDCWKCTNPTCGRSWT